MTVDKFLKISHPTQLSAIVVSQEKQATHIHTSTHMNCMQILCFGNRKRFFLPGPRRVLEELHSVVGFDDWESLRWRGKFGLDGVHPDVWCDWFYTTILWFQKFGFFSGVDWWHIDLLRFVLHVCKGLFICYLCHVEHPDFFPQESRYSQVTRLD